MHCFQQQILIFNCALNCWSRKTNYSQCSLFPHFWHWACSPVCLHNSVRSLTSCEVTDFGGEAVAVIINQSQSRNDLRCKWTTHMNKWLNTSKGPDCQLPLLHCAMPALLSRKSCWSADVNIDLTQLVLPSAGRGIAEHRWWRNGKILTYVNPTLIEKINLWLGIIVIHTYWLFIKLPTSCR